MSNKVKIDLTGVESYQKANEGQHIAKVATAEQGTSQGGNDVIKVAFEVIKGKDKGCRVFETYPLSDTALWKLKGLLQSVGIRAEGKIVLDLDKLVGKVCLIEVVHEEYQGILRAKISETRQLESLDDDEDDDDEDDEEEEETPKAKKPAAKSSKPAPAKSKKPPVEEDEDDEDEEDEDDEEDEPPVKSKKPAKAPQKPANKPAPAKSKKKPPIDDDDDDDEDDWEED